MSTVFPTRRFGEIEVEARTGVVFVRPITCLADGALRRSLSLRSLEEASDALNQYHSRCAGRRSPPKNADYVAALGFVLKECRDVF